MQAGAQATGAANDGAKTTFNPAGTPNTAWGANGPQVPGTHFVISITDTASAARYGLQTASLSRSGDDTATRSFVAPDSAGLVAGEQAFVPSPVAGVLVPNPSTTAPGAYPLATLSYGATTPSTLTPAQRKLYTQFILYAIGDGQTQGVQTGQLPPGYVPLPGSLRLQALNATNSILNPPAAPSTPTPTSPAADTTLSEPTASASTPFTTDTGSPGPDAGTASTPFSGSSAPHTARPATLSLVHTSVLTAGEIRFFLPLLLLIGIGAAVGSLVMARTNQAAAGVSGAPTGPPAGE